MKTYIDEYDDRLDLIPPGVYFVTFLPHYNGDPSRNKTDGTVIKITRQTSEAKLSYWIAKRLSEDWILPAMPALCSIISMSRLDK